VLQLADETSALRGWMELRRDFIWLRGAAT
jgi:hypothetical protein